MSCPDAAAVRRDLERQIRELTKRVEGMENLMTKHVNEGRFTAVTRPPEENHLAEAAERAEAELQAPAPDGRY